MKLRTQSKRDRNSPTPEIGLKCILTQQSGAISGKTSLKDSTPLILVFIHVACLLLGMRRHFQQHEVARLIQMLEYGSTQRDVATALGVTQRVVSRAWNTSSRDVSGRQNPPATAQALTAAPREEWNGINQVSVRRLIRSMPRRCRECIQSRGGTPLKLLYGTSETTLTIFLCTV